MPSMPVSLWGDEDGSRLRDAYYSVFPSVWRHGDWVEFAERGSSVITGRSDATLNRGGVRLGTAELYTVVEDDPAIVDSLVVHLDGDVTRPAGSLVLLVQLVPGTELDGGLTDRLRGAIRRRLSPRHVPDTVAAVPVVPRTVTGKKLEVPVKRYLQGAPLADVADPGALLDPEALASMAAALEPLRSIRTGRGR
jgi:acetoacetyl-CoA synthetase